MPVRQVSETSASARPPNSGISMQERAYRAIRSNIIICRFRPGAKLNEADVAAALQVGRTPVRQAFDRLQHEGLVLVHSRRGVEVRGFKEAELLEIVEARLINEVHAAGLAASRATTDDILALEEIILRSGSATTVSETERMMLLEQEFHSRVAQIAGNTILADILRTLHDRAIRFWFIAGGRRAQRQAVVAQHADIVNAIASGERRAAEAAMRLHIEDFRSSVLRQPGLG